MCSVSLFSLSAAQEAPFSFNNQILIGVMRVTYGTKIEVKLFWHRDPRSTYPAYSESKLDTVTGAIQLYTIGDSAWGCGGGGSVWLARRNALRGHPGGCCAKVYSQCCSYTKKALGIMKIIKW